MNYPENPNPNFSHFYDNYINPSDPELEVSDYLIFEDGGGDGDVFDHQEDSSPSQSLASSDKYFVGDSSSGSINGATSKNSDINCKNGLKMMKKTTKDQDQMGHRVAFRTKSELEVMDDGFKWRKYGKKSVKNSPNPRNYYKCSSGECNVKKRVERDREDPSYVITTYDGIHNHESPCFVYYNTQLPASVSASASANWAFQQSASPPSSSSF